MVKRLNEKKNPPKKPEKKSEVVSKEDKLTKDTFFCTEKTKTQEEAIKEKLAPLQGSILGKPMIKIDILSQRPVLVPYCLLVYNLYVDRSIGVIKKSLDKNLEVGIVYDMNEGHPFQYDIYEEGELPLRKKNLTDELKGFMLKETPDSQMFEQTEEYIQRKVAKKFYGREGKLTLKKKKYFYRPAIELETAYKNGNTNTRYAYLDDFGLMHEHIFGLKVRVETGG